MTESTPVDVDIDTRPEPEHGPAANQRALRVTDWRQVRERYITRRALTGAGVVLVSALLYWYLCWILSSTAPANSDAGNISLQGWDLWHGNPKLSHWITGDVNFYTFETPLYTVVEWFMGLSATTLHVVSALTYTLVMLATAWLAKGDERGMRAWTRFGLVAAFLAFPLFENDLTPTMLGQPDHIGTAVFILLAYLLCDRASGRWGAIVGLFALLVLGQLGDTTVQYVGAIPIVLVCLARPLFARRLIAADLWMAGAAAASIPGQTLLRDAMRHWGAYAMVPPQSQLANSSVWLHQLHSTMVGLLTLFNIPTSTPDRPYWPIAAVLGAFVLLAGIYGLVRTLVRWRSADTGDQLLAIGIPLYLGAYAFSTVPQLGGAYEFLGVVPMIVALAVRNLPLPEPRRLPLVAAGAGIATVAVFTTGFDAGLVTQQETLAAWLKAHQLTYGLAEYWNASSTTVDSSNTVAVRAVIPQQNRYAVYRWYVNTTWYDPNAHNAQFFIADETVQGFRAADVEAVYGKPKAIYQVAGREVMVYQTNLLRTVIQAETPNY